jgi:hypothetical protein
MISFVQEVGGTETGTANTLAVPISASAGDVLAIGSGLFTGATAQLQFIDDSATAGGGTNTYHAMPTGNPMFVSGHNSRGEIWYSDPLVNPITGLTLHFTAIVSAAASVLEFSGVAGVDVSAGASNTSASASSGATAALAGTGELAVGFCMEHVSTAAMTVTASGYTPTTQRNSVVTSANVAVIGGYKLNAGTAAETFTATLTANYWACGVITFIAAAGPTWVPAVISQSMGTY